MVPVGAAGACEHTASRPHGTTGRGRHTRFHGSDGADAVAVEVDADGRCGARWGGRGAAWPWRTRSPSLSKKHTP